LITKQDLLEAIAECQGTRSPNANTAIKLAAFYTILDHLEESDSPEPSAVRNSFAGYSLADQNNVLVQYDGESEFAQTINGKTQASVWPVIDELMTAVNAINQRLYTAVMRKLQ